jgi:monoamine oxidase
LPYEKDTGFLFSEETIPTWWTQAPDNSPILTGWLGGPQTTHFNNASEEAILQQAIQSLTKIFPRTADEIKELLTASHVSCWQKNPYCLGAYTYSKLFTPGARKLLNEPVQDTLYFAGEAMYDGMDGGTVEAALISGDEVSKLIS